MRAQGVAEDALVAAGLVVPRENRPGVYDRFRGRLLFAIRDLQGRVVAFGGRGFGDEQPKYLNSPETPLYSKGSLLYAADLARDTIRERNRALIVEGYVDCLMAHQYGFTETVAALGTAFTATQLAVLRRYCDEVITFFDADAAGRKAAERAEELLEPTGCGLNWGVNRAGTFDGDRGPAGEGRAAARRPRPDTFLRASGAEAFTERITGARSLLSYALDRTISESDTAGPRGRVNTFNRVALMLAKVGDAQEAAALSREACAQARSGPDPALDRGPAAADRAAATAGAVAGTATTTSATRPVRDRSGHAAAGRPGGPGGAAAAGRAGRRHPQGPLGHRRGAAAAPGRCRPRRCWPRSRRRTRAICWPSS